MAGSSRLTADDVLLLSMQYLSEQASCDPASWRGMSLALWSLKNRLERKRPMAGQATGQRMAAMFTA